ncbi:MAG: tRNA (adenosine(37)-N6)-threonylcarbamoyltransferase complex ATPase subunit type 1 TsaE [Vicingus serpentipes]|nr:tRNA (adenosine(37)-N6)-threonylcarbamoyltransferase complex ATPase subunit type 1 TsaE [Vicingus serpentipes]
MLGTYQAKTLTDLKEIAKDLLNEFGKHRVIAFFGEMGVGKTTLIKELSTQLGVNEIANSPTFSIVNEYLTIDGKTLFHFDFYRIEDEEEVYDLGYEDYFYSGNYCFIEWPEKILNLLPENTVKVKIVLDNENNRLIAVA